MGVAGKFTVILRATFHISVSIESRERNFSHYGRLCPYFMRFVRRNSP